MPDHFDDSLVNGLVSGVLLLSLGTWLYVFTTFPKRPILPYEPRRPVPWGALGCFLAVLFAIQPLLIASSGGVAKDGAVREHASHIIQRILTANVSELVIVGAFTFAIAVLYQARSRDLGLPANAEQTARDIFIGVLAWAAAIVPVLGIQWLLKVFFDKTPSGHEYIKMLTEQKRTPAEWAMVAVAVVIFAPVCEEIMFRLLLQGYLEAWEFKKVCRRELSTEPSNINEPLEPSAGPESDLVGLDVWQPATSVIKRQPSRGVAGMPFGLVPIIGSSLLFGLAHFGYGPEPVPLFFLALVLGYIYQRTHRILPSIVTHATFNAFAMFILWRMQLHAK